MKNISLEQARECINHAVDKAASEFGRPICVSVCDTYGYQVAFLRMDGAPIRSIAISQQKAHTATRMGMSTDAFLERLRTDKVDIGYFCDPLMTALPGGNLLTTSGGGFFGGCWRQWFEAGRRSSNHRVSRSNDVEHGLTFISSTHLFLGLS